jgi:vancomycin resistance protein YoaR
MAGIRTRRPRPEPRAVMAPEPLDLIAPAPREWKLAQPRHVPVARLAIAFAVGAAATAIAIAVAAAVMLSLFSNRVVPGVRVGTVDVSGLSRDQVMAALQDSYAYLAQGKATVVTPDGTAAVTYDQAGRKPDLEAMTDAAMAVAHTGNPLADAVSTVKSAAGGLALPVIVRIDPAAIATHLRTLGGANQVQPQNAQVTSQSGTFIVSPAVDGKGIDEKALADHLIDSLTQPNAPPAVRIEAGFQTLDPQITNQDATRAQAAARRMAVNLDLSWTGTVASSSAGSSPMPAGTSKIDAATVASWIGFGSRIDGTYGPVADPTQVEAYVAALSKQIGVAAMEPSVVYDKTGAPTSLAGGRDGVALDVAASSLAVEYRLAALASGTTATTAVSLTNTAVAPQITLDGLSGMVKIGSWTTTFYPDVSNDNGANIRVPAALLNGKVVAPGQQFSFLAAVSPIDPAHGYGLGGVIVHGKSNHTGAMGGGICSASTTMFNAAARAGLEIDERHAHSYYINRYPVGLDATVYSNGYSAMDLRWTNDTPNPILIRGRSTKGSKSTVTFELWSLPLDRTVTFSPEYKQNVLKATDHTEYVSTLPAGQKVRLEYPTDGYQTSRTRTVTDSTGKVIHSETWTSKYEKVDGLLQIGTGP